MNALARVADARTIRIEDELAKRGFPFWTKPRHSNVGAPCPMCGGTDRFSVNTKKQVFLCRPGRGCGAKGDVIALVQALDGVSFLDAIAYLAGAEPSSIVSNIRKQSEPAVKQRDEERQRSINVWRTVWGAAVNPGRTLVEKYLRSRCLDLPAEAAGGAIRFHERCKFGIEFHPAMVCLVRNIASNEPQGIHRTALAADGTAIKRNGKTFRLSLGTIAEGAIKLDPDEDVTQRLCIGEGVETCLSGRQMGLRPVWSAVNTGGIEKFPILAGIEGLHLFAENDANGASAKAVEECARRWHDTGRDVIIVEPDTAKDLNDELREAAR
jgi:Toprim domain/CHC2 zinc finger